MVELMYTRIVSLVPSITELLYDLGLEEEVAGITKFCVHPQSWFRTKTRIGGTKSVDPEKIRSLKPDLIIANKEENVKEQVESLQGDALIWVTDVSNLKDALAMITGLGVMLGRKENAKKLCDKITNAFLNLAEFKPAVPPRIVYLIWRNPYMTIGGDTFISNMLGYCGFTNLFENEIRYPMVTPDQIAALDCSFIFLSSEPYPFKEQHVREIQAKLPAIKILLVDGEMFSWYGSRLLLAAEYFKKLQMEV